MSADIQDSVEALWQVKDMNRPGKAGFFGTYYPDGRVYRCKKCDARSTVVLNGEELRKWFLNHNCDK